MGSKCKDVFNFLFVLLQLFWEKKLSGLNAFDIAEELVKTMELPKGLQGELDLKTRPPHKIHNESVAQLALPTYFSH